MYSTSFEGFINKLSMPVVRKFCITLVDTLPTFHDAQLLGFTEAAKFISEWELNLNLKY